MSRNPIEIKNQMMKQFTINQLFDYEKSVSNEPFFTLNFGEMNKIKPSSCIEYCKIEKDTRLQRKRDNSYFPFLIKSIYDFLKEDGFTIRQIFSNKNIYKSFSDYTENNFTSDIDKKGLMREYKIYKYLQNEIPYLQKVYNKNSDIDLYDVEGSSLIEVKGCFYDWNDTQTKMVGQRKFDYFLKSNFEFLKIYYVSNDKIGWINFSKQDKQVWKKWISFKPKDIYERDPYIYIPNNKFNVLNQKEFNKIQNISLD